MPNCFSLTDKESGKPAAFAAIDDRICAKFGVEPDKVKYYLGWYDAIGFRLAIGKSFAEIKADFLKHSEEEALEMEVDRVKFYLDLAEIVDFLDANYSSDAWYQHK